ncbi:hypothetical protein BDV37DRAFT_261071 [Aspergillus pseudonomiae]|uniref:Uncharacterized protein n=1 Tax=Aspergillus pseudonomiae TaxID=1506151 RepID=A0A5N7CZM6_9EURO|nr:uncharacterized protein BDV37DRAFT_261071 [Aspergillus pseudonomiae]KAE8399267.1 hypothetical protein BDV37DRAFT_261071 [Aspergillus pseudonomiae]
MRRERERGIEGRGGWRWRQRWCEHLLVYERRRRLHEVAPAPQDVSTPCHSGGFPKNVVRGLTRLKLYSLRSHHPFYDRQMDTRWALSSFSKFYQTTACEDKLIIHSPHQSGVIVSLLLALDRIIADRNFSHRLVYFFFFTFCISPLSCAPESQVHVFGTAVCAS